MSSPFYQLTYDDPSTLVATHTVGPYRVTRVKQGPAWSQDTYSRAAIARNGSVTFTVYKARTGEVLSETTY
jgi:hypothetical protein